MDLWANTIGGGNSFKESAANTFTKSDGASYVAGTLTYDDGSKAGQVVPQNSDGSFGTSTDNDGKGYTGSANDTSSNSQNISGNKNKDFVYKGTAPGSFGSADAGMAFVNPITLLPKVFGGIASWANGLDTEADAKRPGAGIVNGRRVYVNENGMAYSYSAAKMPYEVKVVGGKVVDKLSMKVNPQTGELDVNGTMTGYQYNSQQATSTGDNESASEILEYAAGLFADEEGTYSTADILKMAEDAGMAASNAQIQAIIDDPQAWMRKNGALLSEKVPTLDADTTGTNLNPGDPRYGLGEDPSITTQTVGEVSAADALTNPGTETFDASTAANLLGTDATTANEAVGTIDDDNLVTSAQIDMTGAATGVNEDGTASVTGEALNDFATQNISNIIDTSTVAGKLLAQRLGEGGYTDSKSTILGQMKIISAEFKDSNGNQIIPPWAQPLARSVSKSMAFDGITGTAQVAAMSNAIMEATLGIAEKESTFFQTITNKNLDNRQQSIVNKASVLAKFEVANLDNRQAAMVQNAKTFLEMDISNLTNEQQAEVINTQSMVDALFNDQSAINAARLFGADQTNDMAKFYSNLNTQVNLHNSEQINLMERFNAGELNAGAEFNATLEQSRQEFYADMQYNLDLANAKWRQTVSTTNTEMEFEAHTLDVKNTLDLSTEGMTRMWDRVDNMLDYIFKSVNAEADRDVKILATEINAQAGSGGGGNSFLDGMFTLGAAAITAGSDERMKTNIEYYDTVKSIKYYTWEWNSHAKKIGWDKYPTIGVLAQQVQKTHPDAVVVGPEGYLMVNYRKLQ